MHVLQVPITVHFDHGTSKQELVEALDLVSAACYPRKKNYRVQQTT